MGFSFKACSVTQLTSASFASCKCVYSHTNEVNLIKNTEFISPLLHPVYTSGFL